MGGFPESNFIRFWFPVIAYSGIIFIASSIPSVQAPLSEFGFDKVIHILEYTPFGFLVARAVSATATAISPRRLVVWVVLLSFAYAASDEIHQFFVPGRNAGMADLIASTVGGTVGGYLFLFLFRNNAGK